MAADGYHVIVTGATGGLGEAIVQSLLKSERKHRVVGTTRSLGNRKVAELHAWAAELGASERLSFVELDYGSTESVNKGIEAARLQLGGVVDVVVNNAGVAYTGITETFTAEQYLEQLNINVVGPHRVTKAILPSLRSRGSGAIINISSVLGRKVIPFWGVYTSSKFALESQSEALRLELNPVGVQVLVVEPGGIATPIHEATIAGADQHVLNGAGYPEFAEQRAAFASTFRQAVATSTTATPDAVGEALRKLIETPPADRPFRTVVDPLFGGEDVIKLNQVTEEILAANLTSFQSSNLLVLAKPCV